MSSPALPLSSIVNVSIYISPQAPAQPTFNQGLIIGASGVIPSTGANSRMRKYASLAGMIADGFTSSMPEYIAAQLYFSQVPTPLYLWIGCQDPTGIQIVIPHAAMQGTGYVIGNLLSIVQGGAAGATVRVTSVGLAGAITGIALVTSGTGYTIATGLATTGGAGTGAQVDITTLGEPALQAVTACRSANSSWYAFMLTTASVADHLAVAGWAQAANPTTVYFYSTADAAVLNNTGGNVMAVMQTSAYSRSFGIYSTTQSGLYPNNIYAAAAVMGTAMGMNTGLANSKYTLKFKVLVGVVYEPLTPTQVGVIEGLNGNLYVDYANVYTFLEQGVMANGQFFDEIINLDMLLSAIQFNVMNLLIGEESVPQTDPGETQIIQAVNQACEASRLIGFIAPGVWKGTQIINLSYGDALPKGYLSQAYPYSTQSTADRAARKAMPVYVAIIEAGSVHFTTIGVYVQR